MGECLAFPALRELFSRCLAAPLTLEGADKSSPGVRARAGNGVKEAPVASRQDPLSFVCGFAALRSLSSS